MNNSRINGSTPEPPSVSEGERSSKIPPIPKEQIRGQAHLRDADQTVRNNAHENFQSFGSHIARESDAESEIISCKRSLNSRKETLKKDRDKRSRAATTANRRTIISGGLLTLPNLPSLGQIVCAGSAAITLLIAEILSSTLLMYNSGWGLTEHVVVMVGITLTWVMQPFFGTKHLIATLPSKMARYVDCLIAIVGFPLGFAGFYVVCNTLGPMADAAGFSMTATQAAPPPEVLPKSVYIFTAMVSMWAGSYSAFYFFLRALNELWPVTAVDNSEYEVLTQRIKRSEDEIKYFEKKLLAAQHALEEEQLLEEYFVQLCVSYLVESQNELQTLKDAVRLSPLPAAPSLN